MDMRFGIVVLPERSWRDAVRTWVAVEEMGFDHAWTYDHLQWRGVGRGPWYGMVPTLAAAAAVTSRIGLGSLVANARLRDPVVFAKEVMTIDDISGGRAICGVGSGGPDRDVFGWGALTTAQRSDRYGEFVRLTDLLLRQEAVDFDGEHYRCRGTVLVPGCVRRPRVPLGVAAAGPRGMRLAARFADLWLTMGAVGSFEPRPYREAVPVVREQVAALERACREVGRDPAEVSRLLVASPAIDGVLESVGAFEDAAGAFAEVGITDFVVHWPRPDHPYRGRPEVVAEVAGSVLGSRS